MIFDFTDAEKQNIKTAIESIQCPLHKKSVTINFPNRESVSHSMACCQTFDSKIDEMLHDKIMAILDARPDHTRMI